MKLSDKLIVLRKEKGWSQEDFAEKLDVSRQAISRWENGIALPDAQNILRISKLFNVTADYLLNDDYESEKDIPAVESVIEEITPLVRKKKRPYCYLMLVICFVVLIVCAIIIIVKSANDPTKESHTHSELSRLKENEVAPTCKTEGSYDEVIYCAECDKEILRTTQSIPKIAHTLSSSVKENEVAPTCILEGSYDEVIYCTKCNEEILRTHRSEKKIAHQFQNNKCTTCDKYQPSEGLFYMSNGDGTCTVDIGDCTDKYIVIPDYSPNRDKVVQIKAYAFAGRSGVKSIKIPETVTVIGEGAFKDCIDLESVDLPSKITIIDSYTFDGCENLKDVTIPAGVWYIRENAFADCLAFESIVIPASVTKIGKFAFRNFSDCDGTVIFEIYDGWRLYDDSGNLDHIVDFNNSPSDPSLFITFRFCEYEWKRN